MLLQCGAPKIAKFVYNSNNYDLWYAKNYSIHGVYKPTNITGGPHIDISLYIGLIYYPLVIQHGY